MVKGVRKLRHPSRLAYIRDGYKDMELNLKLAAAEEIKKQLAVQKKRYLQMNEEDIVKFVFQGMLGVGHLISSLPDATERLKAEMDSLGGSEALDGSEGEPLIEKISTDWVRLNLRPAKVQGMTAEDIAWYLVRSAEWGALPFTRQNVYNFCVKAYNTDAMKAAAEKVLDEKYLPRHSEVYRTVYKPAYRVLYKNFRKFRKEEEM